MRFETLTEQDRKRQLSNAVDVWEERTDELLNTQRIFPHWRGRPSDEPGGIITMLESARMAWRASPHNQFAFDQLEAEANRLLKLPPLNQSRFLAGSFELAQAIANVVLAVACWQKTKRRDKAYQYMSSAAKLYDSVWPIGFQQPLDIRGPLFAEIDPFEQPKSLNALLFGAFERCQDFIPTSTTILILRELLCRIMGYSLSGSKVEMKGLFLGLDQLDREYAVGHVLDIAVRRLQVPMQGFYPDPISLGVTLIDDDMGASLRAAWRCYLFGQTAIGQTAADTAALRIDVRINHAQVGLLRGESAGGLIAAMMCAIRSQCPLPLNLSATCKLVLTDSQRNASYPEPLDPELVSLGKVNGVVPKLREAYTGHSVDHVFMNKDNVLEWEQAGRPHPQALPVSRLSELIAKLNCDQPLWDEIDHIRRLGEGRWDNIIQHQGDPKTDRDHHHRLDLYVEPRLRVEARPRPLTIANARNDEAGVNDPPRSLLVPGKEFSDESLLYLMALCFNKEADVDWLTWQAANEGYETRESQADEEVLPCEEFSGSSHQTATPVPEQASTDRFRTQASWLCPGRDLLVYSQAKAGKSVLTLRMAHLLNNAAYIQAVFGVKVPTLVVRIEGQWPAVNNELASLRQMIFERVVRQSQHPTRGQHRRLYKQELSQLKEVIDLAIAHQRVVLIIDGFDQFDSQTQQHIVDNHDSEDGRLCRWIIACRQHATSVLFGPSERINDWLRVQITPFDERQRDRFFEKAGLADTWKRFVDPASIREPYLPEALNRLRIHIDSTFNQAKLEGRSPEPVAFDPQSLSDLTPTKNCIHTSQPETEKALTRSLEKLLNRLGRLRLVGMLLLLLFVGPGLLLAFFPGKNVERTSRSRRPIQVYVSPLTDIMPTQYDSDTTDFLQAFNSLSLATDLRGLECLSVTWTVPKGRYRARFADGSVKLPVMLAVSSTSSVAFINPISNEQSRRLTLLESTSSFEIVVDKDSEVVCFIKFYYDLDNETQSYMGQPLLLERS